ncbi:MAG: membrane-bound O-acyltransferase family protein, partial [Flavobacteriales bacterium]
PHKIRWLLLLLSSYFFYLYFKPEYGILIFASTFFSYLSALRMGKAGSKTNRKFWFAIGLGADLLLLGTFKYFDFINENLTQLLGFCATSNPIPNLDLILPIGISFYTFQSLSYTIDVYKRKREAEKHFGYYALYVSFFPQLVAGPIERSSHLIPQLKERCGFDIYRIFDGLKLILWGFFKKLVIADTIAVYLDYVFGDLENQSSMTLILAMYFFIYQVYCDFSGYSDIAIGSAKVFGINLTLNFNKPFTARSYGELWSRWHITLTNWFREYLYIPLGGNKVSKTRWYFNIIFVFGLMGLWHGAAWTFVGFGLLHGISLVLLLTTVKYRKAFFRALGISQNSLLHRAIDVFFVTSLFAVNCIIFRCESLSDYFILWRNVADFAGGITQLNGALLAIGLIATLEFMQRFQKDGNGNPFQNMSSVTLRFAAYFFLIFSILLLGNQNEDAFIYFQF